MHIHRLSLLSILSASVFIFFSCTPAEVKPVKNESDSLTSDTLKYPQEKHLRNVRRLTNGGNNAEAYWSADSKFLTFQSDFRDWGVKCDQIFTMSAAGTVGSKPRMVSTGRGRTTCSYYLHDGKHILYASTHLGADTCPPEPDRKTVGHYVWPVYSSYDIFLTDLEGTQLRQLTTEMGYDAEATVSPDGSSIVFTSTRSGDLELWTMKTDGSDLKQITSGLGYDGGAFFSPDGKKLVFRASRPETPEDQKLYKDLLAKGLVEPGALEIFTCNVDGSDMKQITHLGGANWAPFFHPSGKKIIFASNHKSEKGRQFNLFMVDTEGNNLEQITYDGVFDSFAMFSPDGVHLSWSSNRFNGGTHDTNVFVAEWVD
jgi:TolB protein